MAYLENRGGPKAICDICGWQFNLNALRRQYDGLMVCSKDWSPRHPQEFVRAVPDSQGVRPDMRPEPADVFLIDFLGREDGTIYARESATPYIRE